MVWMIYGNLKARQKKTDEALDAYNQAKSLMPDNVEVDYNLGLLYVKLGRYEQAREHAKAAYAAGFPLDGLRRQLARKGYALE